MTVGTGDYRYQVDANWPAMPEGWVWGTIPALACDSKDRLYAYSRSGYRLVVFDPAGKTATPMGQEVLGGAGAHGIFIDREDNVFCADREAVCVYKFNPRGELVLTIGAPGQKAAKFGDPFSDPTDVAVASNGDIFISDGYTNRRVHKYSPTGKHILSWGEDGREPGQFALVHGLRIDRYDRVWVCDRENDRIQVFDLDGNFLWLWNDGFMRPTNICFDPKDDVVYIAELGRRVQIRKFDGTVLASWGQARDISDEEKKNVKPGEFRGGAHGICLNSRGDLFVGEALTENRMQKFVRVS